MYQTQELRKAPAERLATVGMGHMLCRSRHYQPFTEALKLLKIGRFFPFILLRGPILVARESHEGRAKSDICVCIIRKIDTF